MESLDLKRRNEIHLKGEEQWKVVKNAGSGPGTIKIPDRFWVEYGNGISVGVQAGSPILKPCQKKSKRNCWSNIGSPTKDPPNYPLAHIIVTPH